MCRKEDLNSNLCCLWEKSKNGHSYLFPQLSGAEIPEADWPASLAITVMSRFSVRPCLKGIRQGLQKRTLTSCSGLRWCRFMHRDTRDLWLPCHWVYEVIFPLSFTWMWLSLSVGIQVLVHLAKLFAHIVWDTSTFDPLSFILGVAMTLALPTC